METFYFKYAKKEDISFFKKLSEKFKSFNKVLEEVINAIQRNLPSAKIELSVVKDELGSRVFIILDGVRYNSLWEKYKLEDELEELLFKTLNKVCCREEIREVNNLISLLVV